jgi:lipopolysaccharide export system permease protein
MRRILFRYLLTEQTAPLLVSVMVVTVVLFLGRSMRYTRLLFTSPSALEDLARLFLYSLPYFLAFAIPMATLLGILLAFTRLASDNEITALKTAGLSLYQLFPAVAMVAVSATLVALTLSLLVLPRANKALRSLLVEMATSRMELAFSERVFNDQFKGMTFFINRIAPNGTRFYEVFIADERDPRVRNTIIAEEGALLDSRGRKDMEIRLFRGMIIRVESEMRTAQTIRFQHYDFAVDLVSPKVGMLGRVEAQLTHDELNQALMLAEAGSAEHFYLSKEWHKRLAIPFACLALGLIAAPLSLQAGTATRLSGVVLGLLLFLAYYVLLTGAEALAEAGLCPVGPAMWLPNALFALLAALLWRWSARERAFAFFTLSRHLVSSILARSRKRR